LQVYVTHYFCKINKISFQHCFVGTTQLKIKNLTYQFIQILQKML